jgi:hypothetical protein
MEVSMYALATAAGKIGLRALQGLMTMGAAAAMFVLGRAVRWDPRTTLLMAAVNVFLVGAIVSSVRPQTILFTLIPLAWAFTHTALYASRPRGALIALCLTSAIAVNTHLFFFLTAAPWLLWLADPPRDRRRVLAVVTATVVGWLLTPYLTELPQFLRFGFHSNLLLLPPTPVKEAEPGFIAMRAHWALVPIAVFLSSIPVIVQPVDRSRRWRVVWGSAWLLGLIGFGLGARLVLVWWMMVLPLAAAALKKIADYLMATEDQARRLWRITAVWALCTLLLLTVGPLDVDAWSFEDPVANRHLAPTRERGLEQIAQWLECNTRPNSRGRVYTVFNYGSALTWRLPRFSMSIDGRTIFPDSVAIAEAYHKPLSTPVNYGPWRSADLAIVPTESAVNDAMRHETGWHQVAIAELFDTSAALWVTEKWWSAWGVSPVPRYPLSLVPDVAPTSARSCATVALKPPRG